MSASGSARAPSPGSLEWCKPGKAPVCRVRYYGGAEEVLGQGPPDFTLHIQDRAHLERLLMGSAFSAGAAFLRKEFDVDGDLVAAVRFYRLVSRGGWREAIHAALARFAPHRLESLFQTRGRAARNIRFHYERPDRFYQQFLDQRMVYSCAYFHAPDCGLDQAQLGKLDLICRKLDILPGERFLDIGCGWGALPIHAAERYGALATGCTLSENQAVWARERARESGDRDRISILNVDYRDLEGQYDKIASVGMFEHVGRRRLGVYFRKVCALLAPGGLFLNHGIVRPELVCDDSQTLFLQRNVFPGGELAHLSDVIREAEVAGFEVLDFEDLRPHYALTCRAWVDRLQQNRDACVEIAGEETYRVWLLYLAASAASFEDGSTTVCQMLLGRRDAPSRRLTRDYMFGRGGNGGVCEGPQGSRSKAL